MPPKKDDTEEVAEAAEDAAEAAVDEAIEDEANAAERRRAEEEAEALRQLEEEEDECISRTGVESVDSVQQALDGICEPKLKKNYLEYLHIVKQIAMQNRTCQRIKDQITQRCCNNCRSECEEREIRVIRCCLEKENLKLTCLMQQAIRLQGEDPDRNWKEILIATTIDEDFMPTQMDMNMSKRLTDAICHKEDICAGVSCDPCTQPYSESSSSFSSVESVQMRSEVPNDDVEDFLKCLLRQGDNQQEPNPCGKMNTAMIQKVLGRMQGGGVQTPPFETPRGSRRERQKSDSSLRDKTVQNMQRKINKMQGEVSGLISKRERMVSGRDTDEDQERHSTKTIKALEKTINRMQTSVDALKNKLMSVTEEKSDGYGRNQDEAQDETPVVQFQTPKKTKANELKQLRTAYNDLKLELVQRNAEISDMRRRMKPLIYRSAAGTDNPKDAMEAVERSEVMVLRAKKNELEEEQEEFKCLIKEQAEQLDDYRKKYMEAQQKFEEQKVVIGKMDMNNKRIEEQINSEVQRIKSKFQEKIAELAQYPCILENEQLKLAQISKEKDDLEGKLKIICKELKAMQAQQESAGYSSSAGNAGGGGAASGGASSSGNAAKSDCTEALRKCKIDYGLLEKQHVELLKEKDKISDQLQKTKQDLDTLRTESAKIIARTKERSECTRHSMQQHVDKIERELAQCRANACLSISDREEIIKEMTGQMNTLSFSFDAAQKQVKTLKTQIGFLSNDNTYPVKS